MNGIVYSNASTTKILVSNTYFYCNQRSIQINGNGLPMIATNYNVSNCYFGMGNSNTPTHYAEMLYPSSGPRYMHPLFGIGVDWTFNQKFAVGYTPANSGYNSSNFDIPNSYFNGAPNTFDNMNCGIKSTNSAVFVYQNTFQHIHPYDGLADASFGSAIYASGILNRFHPILYGSSGISVAGKPIHFSLFGSPVPAQPVTFNDCHWGVNATRAFVNVTVTNMSNVLNGVLATNCDWPVTASNNIITGTNKGIAFNSNTGVQNANFNTISVNDPVGNFDMGTLSYPQTFGVSENYVAAHGKANILFNTITGGRFGITSSNSNYSVIYMNTIINTSTVAVTGYEAGIYAVNCTNISIQGNKIDGNGADQYDDRLVSAYAADARHPSAYRKSGICLSSTQTGNICSNDVSFISSIGYGMYFVSDCHLVNVTSNKMGPSKLGMVLTELGSASVLNQNVGSQANGHGNNFNNQGSNGNGTYYASGFSSRKRTYAFNDGSFIPPTFHNFYDYEYTLPTDATVTGLLGILEIGNQASNAPSLACAPPKFKLHARLSSLRNSYDKSLASGNATTLVQAGFESTAPWLLKRRLYVNLCDSALPVLTVHDLPSGFDTLLTAFIDTATDSNMVSVSVDLLGEILSDTASYVPTDSSALLDTSFANFYTMQANSDFNAIQAYENQLQIADTNGWQVDPKDTSLLYNDGWSAVNSLKAVIPSNSTPAHNYKIVQGIYLKLINPNNASLPDSPTLAALLNIAFQCPYIAGDAVYSARALYTQFVDSLYFDDLDLCQLDSNGNSDRMLMAAMPQDTLVDSVTNEFVKLYPNPAQQLVNLVFNVKANGMVNFEVFDQLGEGVIDAKLNGGENFAQYSTINLSNGIYYWRLRDTDRIIKTGKLAIMK